MRNLKRALSLLLSSTMVLGMVAMGGSAAGYQDVDDSYNKEAIEVLQAVGIMTGDENGDFNPDGIVTRNEMAVIMSNLMAYNVATYAGTSPFTDVPEWAEPYVAACYTNGITAGISDTLYGGDQTVTTSQAALMIMKALGYFQYQSDFGGDWQLASITQGNKIDLFEKVNSGVKEEMTRNDVAQLVLNGLKSGTVTAETSGSITVGDTTIVSGVKYNYVTSSQEYAYTISNIKSTTDQTDADASIVELGEKLYQGKLTQASYEEPGSRYTDVFGRPANHWEYQSKEIGTYAQEADTSFSGTVTSKKLYDAVGNTATNYRWYVTVDGEALNLYDVIDDGSYGDEWEGGNVIRYSGATLNANKTDDNDDFLKKANVGNDGMYTGNGTRTEVYVDGTKGAVFVSITHYYAAEVYEVNDGSITLNNLHTYGNYDAKIADINDTYETSESFAEDDIVMYSFADDKIQEVYAATPVEGEVTRVRVDNNDINGDYFDLGEDRYNYNITTDTDDRLTTENVNNNMVGYLDQYGYAAYIDEAAVSYDYAYVLSMGHDGDQYGGNSKTYYARLVLTDGSVLKVETDAKEANIEGLENHIVSYTVDKNDVYTLVARDEIETNKMQGTSGTDNAPTDAELYIENGVASFRAGLDASDKVMSWTANSNTVFIVAESDNQSIEDYDYYVYTGIKNVPDIKGYTSEDGKTVAKVDVAADKNGVAKVVYIEDADVSGAGQVIFARADENAKLVRDTEKGDFYEISAVVDGEVTTLEVKYGSEAAKKLTNTLIAAEVGQYISTDNAGNEKWIVALESITTNADGLVTNVRAYDAYDADKDGYATFTTTTKHTKETVGLEGAYYAYYDDVAVVRYNMASGSFKVSSITSVKDDKNDLALGVFDSGVLNGLCIVEVDSGALISDIPVDVAPDLEFSATFDGVEDEGEISSTHVGDYITIVITPDNQKTRAIGETPTTFEVGHWYQVSINDKKQAPVECTVAGQLTLNYVVKAADEDGIEITGIVEVPEPEEGTDPDQPDQPDPSTPITSVNVTVTVPTKVGETLAAPEAGTGVVVDSTWSGTTAVAGKNTLTFSVAADQGYTLGENFTVTVNGGEPIIPNADGTYTYVVTVTPEAAETSVEAAITSGEKAGEYVFALTYQNKKPDLTNAADQEEVIKAINNILADKGLVVDEIKELGSDLCALSEGEIVGTITSTMVGELKVTINGVLADQTVKTNAAGDVSVTVTLSQNAASNMILAGTGNVASTSTATTNYSAVTKTTTVTLPQAMVASATGDLALVDAYEVDAITRVTVKGYTPVGGEKATTFSAGNFFAVGTSFELEGAAVKSDTVNTVVFDVNGHVKKNVPADTAKQTYTYELDVADLAATTAGGTAKTDFTFTETASKVVGIEINGTKYTTSSALSGDITLDDITTANAPKAGEYIVVTKNDAGSPVVTNAATVTVGVTTAGGVAATVDALNTYATDAYTKGTDISFVLIPAHAKKLTVGTNLEYGVSTSYLTGEEKTSYIGASPAVYVPADAVVTVALKSEGATVSGKYQINQVVGTAVTTLVDTSKDAAKLTGTVTFDSKLTDNVSLDAVELHMLTLPNGMKASWDNATTSHVKAGEFTATTTAPSGYVPASTNITLTKAAEDTNTYAQATEADAVISSTEVSFSDTTATLTGGLSDDTYVFAGAKIATQTSASSAKFATTQEAFADTEDITAGTTIVKLGTTVYMQAGAENKAITANDGAPSLTPIVEPASGVKAIYSFTLTGEVAAGAFTQAI